jgi:hypothetical protein
VRSPNKEKSKKKTSNKKENFGSSDIKSSKNSESKSQGSNDEDPALLLGGREGDLELKDEDANRSSRRKIRRRSSLGVMRALEQAEESPRSERGTRTSIKVLDELNDVEGDFELKDEDAKRGSRRQARRRNSMNAMRVLQRAEESPRSERGTRTSVPGGNLELEDEDANKTSRRKARRRGSVKAMRALERAESGGGLKERIQNAQPEVDVDDDDLSTGALRVLKRVNSSNSLLDIRNRTEAKPRRRRSHGVFEKEFENGEGSKRMSRRSSDLSTSSIKTSEDNQGSKRSSSRAIYNSEREDSWYGSSRHGSSRHGLDLENTTKEEENALVEEAKRKAKRECSRGRVTREVSRNVSRVLDRADSGKSFKGIADDSRRRRSSSLGAHQKRRSSSRGAIKRPPSKNGAASNRMASIEAQIKKEEKAFKKK